MLSVSLGPGEDENLVPESDQSAPVTPLPDLLLLLVLLVGNYVHIGGPKRDCDVTRGPFRIGVTRWRRMILMCGFRKLRITVRQASVLCCWFDASCWKLFAGRPAGPEAPHCRVACHL